jgi:hypothetical protein
LADRLKNFDEVTLMEILEITSEDLVDRFEDFIEDKYEQLAEQFEEEESDEEDY